MSENSIKFFKHLNSLCETQKKRAAFLQSKSSDFDRARLIKDNINFLTNETKTYGDLANLVCDLNIFQATSIMKLFSLFVRENFDNTNFASVASNQKYLKIKNSILANNPEIQFVDDNNFIKQLANAIAHGNIDEIIDVSEIEKRNAPRAPYTEASPINLNPINDSSLNRIITGVNKDLFNKNNFNEKSNQFIEKLKNATIAATPYSDIQFLMDYSTALSDNQKVKLKYESKYTFPNPNEKNKRPQPVTLDLYLSLKEMDTLCFLVLNSQKDSSLQLLRYAKERTNKTFELPENTTPRDTANFILATNDFYMYDINSGDATKITLDSQELQTYVSLYEDAIKKYSIKHFTDMQYPPQIADLLSTNTCYPEIVLNDFLLNKNLTTASNYESTKNLASFFNEAEKASHQIPFSGPEDLIPDFSKEFYISNQAMDCYTETMLAEIWLLLGQFEDKSLYNSIEQNPTIASVINHLSQESQNNINSNTKNNSACKTLLYHIRNSITHNNYLNETNKNIHFYDYTSNNDKTKKYICSITVNQLEKIKDALLDTYCACLENNSQPLQ